MTPQSQPQPPSQFERAIRRFDEENAHDPNTENVDGVNRPKELVYSQWLTEWVLKLAPNASAELRLAARAQHLCRWMSPRDKYPMTRAGYLRWREDLRKFHADKAGHILREVGYHETTIARVQSLILKRDFPHDPEGRVLENALCLVFLQHQFSELAKKSTDEKMINALQKSWKKMTPDAQAFALNLHYGDREKALLAKALHKPPPRSADL